VHAEGIPVTNATSFVLCTDGFWEYVLEEDLGTLLRRSANAKAALNACEKRIKAKLKPESDNYTAQVIRFPNAPKPDRLPRKPKDRSKSTGIFTNRIALLAASGLIALVLVLLLVLGVKALFKSAPEQGGVDKAQDSIKQTLSEDQVNFLKEYALDCYREIERLQTLSKENLKHNPDIAQEDRQRAENITKTCVDKANQAKGQLDRQWQLLQEAEQEAQERQAEANIPLVHEYAQPEYVQAESTLNSALDIKRQGEETAPIEERLNTLEKAKKQFEQAANEFDTALQIAKNKSEEIKKTPPAAIEAPEKTAPNKMEKVLEREGEKETGKETDAANKNADTGQVETARKNAKNARDQAQQNGAGDKHSCWTNAQNTYNAALNDKASDPSKRIEQYQLAKEWFEAAAAQARVDRLFQQIQSMEPQLKDPGIKELISKAENAKDPDTAKKYYLNAEHRLNTLMEDLKKNKSQATPKPSAEELKAAKEVAEKAKQQAQKDKASEAIKAGDKYFNEAQQLEKTDPHQALQRYKEAEKQYLKYSVPKTGEPETELFQGEPEPEISPLEPEPKEKAAGQEAAISSPHNTTEVVTNNAVSENIEEQEEKPFRPNLLVNR